MMPHALAHRHAFLIPLSTNDNNLFVLRQRLDFGVVGLNNRRPSSPCAISDRRWNSSRCSGTSSGSGDDISEAAVTVNNKSLASGREKRKKLIGLAKAVDRGQFQNAYSPGGNDGSSFVAKSGLPDIHKSFCVLGIESSCDDTGGELFS